MIKKKKRNHLTNYEEKVSNRKKKKKSYIINCLFSLFGIVVISNWSFTTFLPLNVKSLCLFVRCTCIRYVVALLSLLLGRILLVVCGGMPHIIKSKQQTTKMLYVYMHRHIIIIYPMLICALINNIGI